MGRQFDRTTWSEILWYILWGSIVLAANFELRLYGEEARFKEAHEKAEAHERTVRLRVLSKKLRNLEPSHTK